MSKHVGNKFEYADPICHDSTLSLIMGPHSLTLLAYQTICERVFGASSIYESIFSKEICEGHLYWISR